MTNPTQNFINYAQKYVPLKIAFKANIWWMRLLSFLPVFNPSAGFVTTLGYTIYLPDENDYNQNQESYLSTITHEFTHMMDYKRYGILFMLSYMLPQLFVAFAFMAFGAIYSNWWLLSLLFLLFALPIPAYFRSHWELRGYSMELALKWWENNYGTELDPMPSIHQFTGRNYYWMFPFKNAMVKRFYTMIDKIKDNSILDDPAYRAVHDWVLYFGRIKLFKKE